MGNCLRIRQVSAQSENPMNVYEIIRQTENSYLLIRPQNDRLIPEIGEALAKAGLEIMDGKMVSISRAQAEEIYQQHRSKDFFFSLINITEGKAFIFEITGNQAIARTRQVLEDIRQRYGINPLQDCVHAPDNEAAYLKESKVLGRKS